MSAELMDLAEKASKLEGWRWERGMSVIASGPEAPEPVSFKIHRLDFLARPVLEGRWSRIVPDLADPFTGGCMLRQLGEGWKVSGGRGFSVSSSFCLGESGKTLGEACARSALASGGWATPTLQPVIANDPLYW